jgi:hypothetical protein
MTKSVKVLDTHKAKSRQLSLFEEIAKIQEGGGLKNSQLQTGSKNVQAEFKEAIAKAMSNSGLSRFEIAGKMSDLLAADVSKFMLDAWVAESKDGHRLPAEYLPAFCLATGSSLPLEVVCRHLGLFLMPGDDALRSEIQIIDERIKDLQKEKKKRVAFLK